MDSKESSAMIAPASIADVGGPLADVTSKRLFWLSLLLLMATIGTEIAVLFLGYQNTIPDIVVGRVLGMMDSISMLVLAFWFGSTSGSARKTELLAAAPALPIEENR